MDQCINTFQSLSTLNVKTKIVLRNYNCPICNAPDEDIMHVVTCRSPSALELRETQLQELQLRLRSRNTDPIITSFLITGIRSCFRDPYHGDALFHQCHTGNPTTFRALKEELDIGWFALLFDFEIFNERAELKIHSAKSYTKR